MYCPICRAEFREGFYRCIKCDADLVDSLPDEASVPDTVARPGWVRRLYHINIGQWLKTGAIIYVAVELVLIVPWQSGALQLRFPANSGEIFGVILSLITNILSTIMSGLIYYGVGHIIGLLQGWVTEAGVQENGE